MAWQYHPGFLRAVLSARVEFELTRGLHGNLSRVSWPNLIKDTRLAQPTLQLPPITPEQLEALLRRTWTKITSVTKQHFLSDRDALARVRHVLVHHWLPQPPGSDVSSLLTFQEAEDLAQQPSAPGPAAAAAAAALPPPPPPPAKRMRPQSSQVSDSRLEMRVDSGSRLSMDPTTRDGCIIRHSGEEAERRGRAWHLANPNTTSPWPPPPDPLAAMEMLPPHPSPHHPAAKATNYPRVILKRHARELLTQVSPQPAATHPVQLIHQHLPDQEPYCRTLYCSWEALDELGARRYGWLPGEALRRMQASRQAWVDSKPEAELAKSSGGTQGASGAYTELGVGSFAGGSRRSETYGGRSCHTPIHRNRALSDQLHDPMGAACAVVALALEEWYPECKRCLEEPGSASPLAASAFQYPRSPAGEADLYGNQLAVRAAGTLPEEAGAALSMDELKVRALQSGSDLHTDKLDGSRPGTGTVAFYCWLLLPSPRCQP